VNTYKKLLILFVLTAVVVGFSGCQSNAVSQVEPVESPGTCCQGNAVSKVEPVELPGTWTNLLAEMPAGQYGCTSVALDGKFHLIGGSLHSDTSLNRHQAYDPVTDSWATKKAYPEEAGWATATVYDGKIYSFGGDTKGSQIGGPNPDYYTETDGAYVYDPATNKWSALTPLPAPRSYHAAIAVGDHIYIFGSRTRPTPGKRVDMSTYRYDIAADNYTRMADIPTGHHMAFINRAYYNGYIYAVAGQSADGWDSANGTARYEIATNTWTWIDTPKIISPRTWTLSQHSDKIIWQGTKMIIAGGYMHNVKERTDRVTYFDLESETFAGELDQMPQGRCCGALGVLEGLSIGDKMIRLP